MYNLHLTAEQLEFRDTLRDFVEREVKPAAVHPTRLEPFAKPLLKELLDGASQMGLRALTLPEDAGGAGADGLTACIVLEELAVGDVDLAVALGETAMLARALHDSMNSGQRKRFLAQFVDDDKFHLALAGGRTGEVSGWCYSGPAIDDSGDALTAAKQGNDWVINGTAAFVSNAPIAKLIAVQARTDPKKSGASGLSTLLVPRDAAGLSVGEPVGAFGGDGQYARWHHGTGSQVVFKNCKVPAESLLGKENASPLADGMLASRATVQLAAINLGVGRAAYEAAVDYAKIRRQGARMIAEHQSIGTKLADIATKLEVARNLIWKAAWSADHPEAVADRSVPGLPLDVMARTFTAEAVHRATLEAAECFGAMGVMRDMPLQKYVHDTLVLLHYADNDSASTLRIAEAVAGYERARAA